MRVRVLRIAELPGWIVFYKPGCLAAVRFFCHDAVDTAVASDWGERRPVPPGDRDTLGIFTGRDRMVFRYKGMRLSM